MSNIKNLLEKMDQFAGQAVGQKPGDQVRGTEKARTGGRDHPFKGRLVGASESTGSLLRELEQELNKPEAEVKRDLFREFAEFKQQTEESLDEDLKKWFKEKWVRFGPDGKIRGDCARGDDSEGKPKCLPQSKAHSLGKKGRASAAARKRREDPNPERSGKAINVNTKKKSNESTADQQLDEKCWTGYHKEGNKELFGKTVPNCVKNEDQQEQCPHCGGAMFSEHMMNEKQDACYYKVKSRYKVWPSAYASGALVKCRKAGAKNWGNKSESVSEDLNPTDTVQLDIPLLIRLLEYAKEDAKTDMDLHSVAERLIAMSSGGDVLSMDQYDAIVGGQVDEEVSPTTMPGAAVTPAANPAAVAQMKAQQLKTLATQKKATQDQIKQTQDQLNALRKQLATLSSPANIAMPGVTGTVE